MTTGPSSCAGLWNFKIGTRFVIPRTLGIQSSTFMHSKQIPAATRAASGLENATNDNFYADLIPAWRHTCLLSTKGAQKKWINHLMTFCDERFNPSILLVCARHGVLAMSLSYRENPFWCSKHPDLIMRRKLPSTAFAQAKVQTSQH